MINGIAVIVIGVNNVAILKNSVIVNDCLRWFFEGSSGNVGARCLSLYTNLTIMGFTFYSSLAFGCTSW